MSAHDLLERVERAVDDDEQRVGAQIIEQRRRRLEEQRQVVLDAGRQLRVGDRAVDGAASRLDGKMLAKALAKELDRGFVERELASGQNLDLVGLARRTLRLCVERAQGFDLVVEQIDADGRRAAGREDVEHSAAHRELAGLGDLLDAQVAVLAQAFRHLGRVESVACGEIQRARHDELRRRQPLEQRAGLEYQRLGLAAREPIQRQQPIREQVLRRRDRLVGQRLVVGEAPQAAPAEERHLALDPVCFRRRRRDDADGALRDARPLRPRRGSRPRRAALPRCGAGPRRSAARALVAIGHHSVRHSPVSRCITASAE